MRIGETTAIATVGAAIVVPPDTGFELGNDGDAVLRLLCCFPVGGQATLNGESFTPPWAE